MAALGYSTTWKLLISNGRVSGKCLRLDCGTGVPFQRKCAVVYFAYPSSSPVNQANVRALTSRSKCERMIGDTGGGCGGSAPRDASAATASAMVSAAGAALSIVSNLTFIRAPSVINAKSCSSTGACGEDCGNAYLSYVLTV